MLVTKEVMEVTLWVIWLDRNAVILIIKIINNRSIGGYVFSYMTLDVFTRKTLTGLLEHHFARFECGPFLVKRGVDVQAEWISPLGSR